MSEYFYIKDDHWHTQEAGKLPYNIAPVDLPPPDLWTVVTTDSDKHPHYTRSSAFAKRYAELEGLWTVEPHYSRHTLTMEYNKEDYTSEY